MRFIRTCIIGIAVLLAPHFASAQAQLIAVGDLPGGPFASQVRDATVVGPNIIAVGGSASHNQPGPVINTDTPMIWFWNGTTGSMFALPPLVANTTAMNGLTANAITPSGSFIAAGARSNAGNNQFQAVRVATSTFTNLNLAAAPFPVINPSTNAVAISSDGLILYGSRPGMGVNLAVRWDVNASSNADVPLLGGTTANAIAPRGSSSDGAVAVGWAFVAPNTGTNNKAFRFVNGVGSTQIPFLGGGTWNRATAVTPNGNLVLVAGNSTAFPNGEMYLYDATGPSTTSLGSPNTLWAPGNFAGMTSDGSVIVTNYISSGGQSRHAYFHNNHGWFHIMSALLDSGVDAQAAGWDSEAFQVNGINADGTLLWGQGIHNGNLEGWVATFPSNALVDFDAAPVAPADTSIVGSWLFFDPDFPEEAEVVSFLPDGTYYFVNLSGNGVEATPGFERGRYYWTAAASGAPGASATGNLTLVTVQDTNGGNGASSANGVSFPVSVTGDTLLFEDDDFSVPRINDFNSHVGGWYAGDPAVDNSSAMAVFLSNGVYFMASDGSGNSIDGIEVGTYSVDPTTNVLTSSRFIDTNGASGLSDPEGTPFLVLEPDKIHLDFIDDDGTFVTNRIADPNAVAVLPPTLLSVTPNAGSGSAQAFAYTFSDPNGFADINSGLLLINGTPSLPNGCVVLFVRSTSQLFLLNDNGSSFGSAITLPTASSLENSQCEVLGTGSSFSGSDENLTVTVNLEFKGPFAGAKINLTLAQDDGAHSSGFQVGGTFTVPNAAPTVAGVSPNSGTGASQTFTYTITDAQGGADVSNALIFITGNLSLTNSCLIFVDRVNAQISLLNDAGTGFTSGIPGNAGTLQNSQCSISVSGTSLLVNDEDLDVTIPITFKAPYIGGLKFHIVNATDSASAASGFQAPGSWTP